MDILRQTLDTTQSVASAMTAVVDSWHGHPDDSIRKYGYASCTDTIERCYPAVCRQIEQAREFIVAHWIEISQNNVMQMDVKDYLADLAEFFEKLRAFETEFCMNNAIAFTTFKDAWIARKYFVKMLELQQMYKNLYKQFEEHGKKRAKSARPFRGMAVAFRDFFLGVTDTQLENLIIFHKPFSVKAVWLGERVEAALFARFFGLTAKDMNHSFVIYGHNGFHRDLNLSSELPKSRNTEYAINAPLEMYKHCKA